MPTEAPPVFYLSCLQLVLLEAGRRRRWMTVPSGLRSGGRTTHVLDSEGLFHAEVLGNRSSDWILVTDVLTYADRDVRQVRHSTDLTGCRDYRPARRALQAELDRRLDQLRTALLAHTGMSPAAAQVFTAMCRNDWRLGGDDLVTAAEAAKAAVA